MKLSRLFLTPCFLAAERIYEWLGRDRNHLFPSFLRGGSVNDFLIPSKCDWIKPPKTPARINQLPFHGFCLKAPSKFKISEKSTIDLHSEENLLGRSALEVQHCINQKTPYIHCEQLITKQALPSNRIFTWKLKEHFLAVRKIKSFHKQLPPIEKYHDFVPLIPQVIGKGFLKEGTFFKRWL